MEAKILERLTDACKDNYYNPYKLFDWSEILSEQHWWMSPELLSVHNTSLMEELDESQLKKLSKWESINFYSLNVHGIRELLLEVTKRLHKPDFDNASEFFHHYIGEENEHMWFFAKFCLTYGEKIYPDKQIKSQNVQEIDLDIESFLVFARILIFEEIVDYFNVCMGSDKSLPPIIQKINKVHHQDESRHIAFGRQIVAESYSKLCQRLTSEQVLDIENYLKRYIISSIESLYNPAMYRDAGIPEPYKIRRRLLEDSNRKVFHQKFLQRTLKFLLKNKILSDDNFV
jgi:hypothetical protein